MLGLPLSSYFFWMYPSFFLAQTYMKHITSTRFFSTLHIPHTDPERIWKMPSYNVTSSHSHNLTYCTNDFSPGRRISALGGSSFYRVFRILFWILGMKKSHMNRLPGFKKHFCEVKRSARKSETGKVSD